MRRLVFEKRFFVEKPQEFSGRLRLGGGLPQGESFLVDYHFSKSRQLKDLRWSQSGYAARLRQSDQAGRLSYEVQERYGVGRTNEGFGHDVTEQEGHRVRSLSQGRDFFKKKGLWEISRVEKTRQVYTYQSFAVHLDRYPTHGSVVEFKKFIAGLKEQGSCQELVSQVLKIFGLDSVDLISTSPTNLVLESRLGEDPEIKIKILEEELAKLEQRMSQTLAKSNEIYELGGDEWHDNPAYDLMNADVDKIGSMMDDIREELKRLRRQKRAP